MAVIALPSFSKGEIAPSLHARVDTAMYKTGLRRARNAIIHPYGGISNRPGTVCIGPVKDHTVSTTRLFRFHLGDTDQYVLEFGAAYMRVIRNDAIVLNAGTTITAITAANPVVVTAASHGLSAGDEIVLSNISGMIEVDFGRYIVADPTTNTFELTDQVTGDDIDGTTYTAFITSGSPSVASVFELTTPYAVGDLSTLKIVQSGNVITVTHPTYAPRDITRTDHNAWTISSLTFAPTISAPTALIAAAGTNTNFIVFSTRDQTVRYEVTSIEDTDQFFEESLTIQVTLTDSSDPPLNQLSWTAEPNADRYAVYREDNGLFGLIGETEAVSFEDDNFAADLTISPPRARNPFSGAGNFPATSGYYEQRQLYAGSNNKPDTLYASQTGLRLNMSVSSPLQADDAITASLSAQDVQIIRHFVPLDDLITFTNAGEWRINSGGDNSFSSDTIRFKPQEFWGADHMQPIVFGNTILYVEDGGGRVRSLGFSFQSDGYQSTDMNLLANHLLVEEGPSDFIITDWTHQQFPEPRLYIVRSDGQLLTMTFNQEQQVIAWTTWDTKGEYESCTSLRRSLSNVEDGVYFIVKRRVNGQTVRLIERMHTRKFADVRDTFFLDAGKQLDSPVVITGVTTADPAVFSSTAHGFSDGDEVEITGIEWNPDVDDLGNETNPDQFNNQTFTLANTNANFFEILKRKWGNGTDIDISNMFPETSFNLIDHAGEPKAAIFNTTGSKMYTVDVSANTILEYDLSINWDIATAVHSSVTFDFSALTTDARGMTFGATAGTTILLAGVSSVGAATIYELTLSSGFDLSTTSDSGRSADISGTVDDLRDIDSDKAGTRLYVTAENKNIFSIVFQFSMTGSNASTIAYAGKCLNVSVDDGARHIQSGFMRKNGTQLFLLDDFLPDTVLVYEYRLSIAFEIESAELKTTTTLAQIACPRSMTVDESDADCTDCFSLVNAVDSGLSVTGEVASHGPGLRFGGSSVSDIEDDPTLPAKGERMYITSSTGSTSLIYQYNLSTPWDVSTAGLAHSLDVFSDIGDAGGLTFKNDGLKFFIANADVGSTPKLIESYTLTTAWELSTATDDGTPFDVSGQIASQGSVVVNDVFVRDDGLKMFVLGEDEASPFEFSRVFQYTLAVSWDLTTATYDGVSFNPINEDNQPRSFVFLENPGQANDGTKMYIAGNEDSPTAATVNEYDLSTPWDISTAVFNSVTIDTVALVSSRLPFGLDISDLGDKLFIMDGTGGDDKVIQITLATIPDRARKFFITTGCGTPAIWSFQASVTTGDEGLAGTETYFRGGEFRLKQNIISGLQCLNGEVVKIVADGSLEADQTVVNNTITIADGRKVARASVGLSYITDIETLNIEVATSPSTVQDKQKKITDVLVRFYKSRMPFIGPDSFNMTEMKGREFEKYGEATALLSGDRTVNIPPSWNSNGRMFIRMKDPMPLTILGLFPDITAEDSLE